MNELLLITFRSNDFDEFEQFIITPLKSQIHNNTFLSWILWNHFLQVWATAFSTISRTNHFSNLN